MSHVWYCWSCVTFSYAELHVTASWRITFSYRSKTAGLWTRTERSVRLFVSFISFLWQFVDLLLVCYVNLCMRIKMKFVKWKVLTTKTVRYICVRFSSGLCYVQYCLFSSLFDVSQSVGYGCVQSASPTHADHVFKIVFVGDSGVGKTCVIYRFCRNSFRTNFTATIGLSCALLF